MNTYVVLWGITLCSIACGQLMSSKASNFHYPIDVITRLKPGNVKPQSRSKGPDCCIIFPDKMSANSVIPRQPPKFVAKGKGRDCVEGVCKDAIDYPREQIGRIKHQLVKYSNIFGTMDGVQVINTRVGEEKRTPLCEAVIQRIHPKLAKNSKGIEKFIINEEKTNYTQGFFMETCRGKGAQCKLSNYFPNHYTSECVQKFATMRLIALNEDGHPAYDTFVIPSCCACGFKHNSD